MNNSAKTELLVELARAFEQVEQAHDGVFLYDPSRNKFYFEKHGDPEAIKVEDIFWMMVERSRKQM